MNLIFPSIQSQRLTFGISALAALLFTSQLNAEVTVFQVTPNSSNVVTSSLTIDNPACNNKPGSILTVLPVYVSAFFADPIGVIYDQSTKRWQINDEAQKTIPFDGSVLFNLRVETPGAKAFVLDASAENSTYDWTSITNHTGLNNINALLLVTHNENRGVNQTNTLGVYTYIASLKIPYKYTWAVYNENASAALAASYHVVNITGFNTTNNVTNKVASFLQTTTSANVFSTATEFTNGITQLNPHAIIFATHNYDPGYSSGNYNNHPLGAFYDTFNNQWTIFNEDNVNLSTNGIGFNVQVFSGPMTVK